MSPISRTTLAGYTFGYDLASRITSIEAEIDGLSEFDYDNTNQLTIADHTGRGDEAYAYDENGNRTGGSYSVDPNNQLASDGTYNYTYDAEGNRLTRTKISNDHVTRYEWDHRNRLVTITEEDDEENVLSTVDQLYDPFNHLISISVDEDGPGGDPAADTFFSYLAGQIVVQFDGDEDDDLSHRYLWNPASIDHLLIDEAVSSLASEGDLLFPLGDHLNTNWDLAEYDGEDTTIANHRRYTTYGVVQSETNAAIDELFGYTGRSFIEATGLQNNLNRWYDPTIGRWISEDPIGVLGGDANFDRYVFNNPVNALDPSGLEIAGPHYYPYGNAPASDAASVAYFAALANYNRLLEKYNRELFAYDKRVIHLLLLVGEELYLHGIAGANKKFPELYIVNTNCTSATGITMGANGGSALQAIAGSLVAPFPSDWPSIYKAILHFERYYGNFSSWWLNESKSLNLHGLFIPSPWIFLLREHFYSATETAIYTLIHEPMHDPSQHGAGHGTIKDVVPTGGVGGMPISRHGSQMEQLINFMRVTKCNGKSMWQRILDAAGPAPIPPIQPIPPPSMPAPTTTTPTR